jgi:hypothetical protein|tara:strand:- start:13146 stop:13616 length:471 start_codon:yes stop_codon:yes gene_type:complete
MNLGFDGVGTKIEIAERMAKHKTVAHDLFAMVCDDAVVRGGKSTRDFIRVNFERTFKKEPDFLEVFQKNGEITKLKIIDAKTSPGAKRPPQENAFKEFCKGSGVDCSIEYAIPKSGLGPRELADVGCLAVGAITLLATKVPPAAVKADAICLLMIS